MLERWLGKFSMAWCIVVSSSLFAGFMLIYDLDKPDYYFFLPLLPLAFALTNMLSLKIYKYIYKNIGLILVISLYYIRLVIVPVIMSIGDYTSIEKTNVSSNMPAAVALMVYELAVVYIVLYLSVSRDNYIEDESKISNLNDGKLRKIKTFGVIIICILLFDIIVYVLIPESRYLYTNIFNAMQQTSYDIVNMDNIVARGNLKRACITLYSMTVEFMRVFVPAYFMPALRRVYGEKIKGIILSVPLILMQFMLVSNTQANSILCVLVLMLLIAKLYPSWSKRILGGSLFLGLLFIVWYFAYKYRVPSDLYSGTSMGERASELTNAYFSGPDNIAAVFNITGEDRWAPLSYTLISSIPFNGTLFGINGLDFSSLYNSYNGSQFQIAPCIGESYFYLGSVLSPIVPAIFTYMAVRYGRKSQLETNLWKYVTYVYFTLLLSMSLTMYNGAILLKTFMGLILPMMILFRLSDEQKLEPDSKKHYVERKYLHIRYKINKSIEVIE